MNENLIFSVIFLLALFLVLGSLAIFYLHIKNFKNLAPHIIPTFRVLLIIIAIMSIFILFQIFTSSPRQFSEKDFDISTNIRYDF